jgi:hypothetical protein
MPILIFKRNSTSYSLPHFIIIINNIETYLEVVNLEFINRN